MGHEAEPVLESLLWNPHSGCAASPSAAARREPVCPEAAVSLGSGSSYLHILSCSLLWVQIGLTRCEKGTVEYLVCARQDAWHFA